MTDLPIRRAALDELVLAAHAARDMLDEAAEHHKPAYGAAVRLDFALLELQRAGVSIDKYGEVTWPQSGPVMRAGLLDQIERTAAATAANLDTLSAGVQLLAGRSDSARGALAADLVDMADAAVVAHRVLIKALRFAAGGDAEANNDLGEAMLAALNDDAEDVGS